MIPLSFLRQRTRRAVLARTACASVLAAVLALAPAVVQAQRPPSAGPNFNVVPISVSNVVITAAGTLEVVGVYGSNVFTAPLDITAQPNQNGGCPILNLALAPIHLNVAGLTIDTSNICLDVVAHQNRGLLGDLLCGIANLLSDGVPLANVLSELSPAQAERLSAGLTSLLNQAVFTPISAAPALVGASCEILNLALGPLELNLLGLEVSLDNCANGPVTLDVRAVPGGGLLGDLLCNLTNLLNNPAAAQKILRQIAAVISQLLA